MIRCRRHREREVKLLQVAHDEGLGLVCQRNVGHDRDNGLPVRGGWERPANHDLEPGVYCRYCLDEGRTEPIDIDETEYNLLGRAAFFFPKAGELNLENVWTPIERRFQKQIVHWHDTPERKGIYDMPASALPGPLLEHLRQAFPKGLYRHQARATDLALTGKDVVVATATASGKSLCYVLPVLTTLLTDPAATALYVAPTQALAEDQFGQWLRFSHRQSSWKARAAVHPEWNFMREVHLGATSIIVARYDGGTEGDAMAGLSTPDLRRRIRGHQPHIVITTPEMLHAAILARHELWGRFLQGLRYVILDEMHSYKGLFGASMAQVIRRLQRRCDLEGAAPRFIGCSATIRNPEELAQSLLGRPSEVLQRDGAPRRRRRFVIMDSARAEEPVVATARNLMVELVRRRRLRSILFTRSIGEADQIYNRVQESLREYGMEDLVRPYKAILPAATKREIAESLRLGRRAGVVTTNALELGVDIGELSAAVLVKFPGSMSSLLQQAGRVGRRSEGLVFLLADDNPLNQFFVQHPEEFFALKPEEVYLDPGHRFVLADHLVCAAKEAPLDAEGDQRYFGPGLPQLLTELEAEGRLQVDGTGRYVPANPEFHAKKVGLRNQDFFEVPIMHMGTEITRETGERAPRTLHKNARIQLENAVYEVESLHLNWKERAGRAVVRMARDNDYVTAPFLRGTSQITRMEEQRKAGCLTLARGPILIMEEVVGYYQMPVGPRTREEERKFHLLGAAAPPPRHLPTQAVWIALPAEVVGGMTVEQLAPMLRSMQKALAMAACIHLRCDLGDLAGMEMPAEHRVFLYDTQAGGTGLAAKVYEHAEAVWETARRILADCPFCSEHPESHGCPKCVTDEYGLEEGIDRQGALELFERLRLATVEGS